MRVLRKVCLFSISMFALLLFGMQASAQQAGAPGSASDSATVMQAFNEQAKAQHQSFELTDDEKHQVLFFMGVTLLILLCATAYLGISMGVWGKNVFVAHMVCAGLTVTLAFAHAVAAAVWFFPF